MLSTKTLIYLVENQRKLDKYILDKHNLNEVNLVPKKILAFLVELGEFINEQRDFKYWSNKPPSDKETLLEEYIDGIHFLISLAITLNYDLERYSFKEISLKESDLTSYYLQTFSAVSKFYEDKTIENFYNLLNNYFTLAKRLNFTEEEITQSYQLKNKENFNRQDNNY